MERKRLRLPRSDSGRLIRSIATFTSNGTAASAPTETRAIAVAWRKGRRTLSATSIPIPRPNAVRASESKPSRGTCSPVFGMDIERDIGYPYTSRFGKGNGKISPPARFRAGCSFYLTNHAKLALCPYPRRRKWRAFLAAEPASPAQATVAFGCRRDPARAGGRAARRPGSARAPSDFDERRSGSG